MDPTARFVELVEGPEDDLAFALDEAALLIAAHAEPDVDVDAYLERLDALASTCPEPNLGALTRHLFVNEGFAGNSGDYYDPANSYLDHVIDRRVGIPITLSLLTMAVGWRLGIRLQGVGAPGHFVVRLASEPPIYLDPFNGGEVIEGDDLADYVVGPRQILLRMLTNLRQIHLQRQDAQSLEWVLRLRNAIPGVPADEQAELAGVLVARCHFGEAAAVLAKVAARGDLSPEESSRYLAKSRLVRARLN